VKSTVTCKITVDHDKILKTTKNTADYIPENAHRGTVETVKDIILEALSVSADEAVSVEFTDELTE
jgi:hypothetical protein